MFNPPHLGEMVRENMDEVGWNLTETAARLGCEQAALCRGCCMAGQECRRTWPLALEALGWGTAEHWMRMQASYELAAARRATRTIHAEAVPH